MKPALRIAWFSPLSPVGDSLGAYCSEIVLPLLKDRFDIEVFCDRITSDGSGIPTRHYATAFRRHREKPFDIFFYNIEDGLRSRFTRAHLGTIPGIVWLHDWALGDLGAEAFRDSPWETTIRQFADPREPFQSRTQTPQVLWPQAYRETMLASLVLSSSRSAVVALRALPGARVETVLGGHRIEFLPPPLPRSAPPPFPEDSTLVIASACRAGIDGQMHKVFSALSAVGFPWKLLWMVDGGDAAPARALLDEFGAAERTEIVVGRSPENWERIMARAKVCLHLQNSYFHHLGPYLHQSLAAARPALVCGVVGSGEFPDDAVFRIETGTTAGAQLQSVFEALHAAGSGLRWGQTGRELVLAESAAEGTARRLAEIFTNEAPYQRSIIERWEKLLARGEKGLFDEIRALLDDGNARGAQSFELLLAPFAAEIARYRRSAV